MNRVEQLLQTQNKPEAFARGYFDYLSEIFKNIDCNSIANFMECILDARERGAMVFFLGNGGSAATASHFANDLSIGTRSKTKPFRVMSLTDNVAVMTAVGNDNGYEYIFEFQLKALMQKGDVVVGISASGNSPNVLRAMQYAKDNGAKTVGITGFEGGELKGMVDLNLHVPTAKGEYGPVEDLHMIFDHMIHAYVAFKARTT